MLFQSLIQENIKLWDDYLHHNFVKKLQNETLARENFLFYLKQDYIFLIQYAKCYALLALNANNTKELRFAMKFQNYILEGELELHKSILELGIEANKLSIKDESIVNIAYTRYILSVGQSGDFLDLLVALSACAIGYGYIGKELYENLGKQRLQNHAYKEWILTYSDKKFQEEIKEFEAFLNFYTDKISEEKFKKLSKIFGTVVRLEIAFWQHGLSMNLDI